MSCPDDSEPRFVVTERPITVLDRAYAHRVVSQPTGNRRLALERAVMLAVSLNAGDSDAGE